MLEPGRRLLAFFDTQNQNSNTRIERGSLKRKLTRLLRRKPGKPGRRNRRTGNGAKDGIRGKTVEATRLLPAAQPFSARLNPVVSFHSNDIPIGKISLQCNNPVLPCRMLMSFSLASSFQQLRVSFPSPQFRPLSPPPNARHDQIPLPPNRPFRMITIRIAPRVNPFPSQRYKFPYRRHIHSRNSFVFNLRIMAPVEPCNGAAQSAAQCRLAAVNRCRAARHAAPAREFARPWTMLSVVDRW